jgi:hypothetical protein
LAPSVRAASAAPAVGNCSTTSASTPTKTGWHTSPTPRTALRSAAQAAPPATPCRQRAQRSAIPTEVGTSRQCWCDPTFVDTAHRTAAWATRLARNLVVDGSSTHQDSSVAAGVRDEIRTGVVVVKPKHWRVL